MMKFLEFLAALLQAEERSNRKDEIWKEIEFWKWAASAEDIGIKVLIEGSKLITDDGIYDAVSIYPQDPTGQWDYLKYETTPYVFIPIS